MTGINVMSHLLVISLAQPPPHQQPAPTTNLHPAPPMLFKDPDGGADDADVQAFLRAQYGSVDRYITSVDDYLQTFFNVDTQTGGGAAIEQQAHAAMLQQLEQQAPQLLSGAAVLERMQGIRLLPVDCSSLDGLLLGGVRETHITELSGETCTGKTQLCHLAAVTTALRGERVLYIDTTNAFSATRASQLVAQSNPEEPAQAALSNITVVRCHSIHALLSSLDELALQAGTSEPADRPKLLVIDSISALLAPVIGGLQHNQGHVIVAETGRMLRHVAEALQLAVLLTNHVVGTGGWSDGSEARATGAGGAGPGGSRLGPSGISLSYKPALGEQWRGVPHARVQLSKAAGNATVATLLAHTLVAPGCQALLEIGETITSSDVT